MTTAAEVTARFDASPMTALRIRAVGLTAAVSALDGYDSLSISFAAPAIATGWHIGKAALGVVLSSGLVGVAIGSLAFAPLADVAGRRSIVLAGIAAMATGSLLCADAETVPALAAWRVVTGLGIGMCVAVINPIAAEFANARRRTLAMAAMAVGFPVGGLVGGLLASWLLTRFAWPAIFVAGFVAALVLFVAVAAFLPESLAFLLGDARPKRLARLNSLLIRTGHPILATMPAAEPVGRGYTGVFAPAQAGRTMRLAAVSLLFSAAAYFVLSWLPQMVSDAGHGAARASLAAAIASLAGIVASLMLGISLRVGGVVRAAAAMLVGFGVTTAGFGLSPVALAPLLAIAATCGFFLYGAASTFYTTLPISFPDRTRAAGTGFVIGVGRVSSAATPALAGWMFARGFDRAAVCGVFAALAILAAVLLAGHRPLADGLR